IFVHGILGFDMFLSDVSIYWKESLQWRTPFSTWFVPGYSLIIALMRGLTGNILPPIFIMLIISGVSYVIAVRTVYEILQELHSNFSLELALLFSVYPFVGLAYSVYPLADSIATAFLVLCVLAFIQEKWVKFTILAGLALLVHKALWFFIPLLT